MPETPFEFSTVLICDDHDVSALGVEMLLREYSPNPLQIRKATSGKMALKLFAQASPDLTIIDLGLPDMHGLDLIKQIRDISPTTRVIVLTGLHDPHALHQARQLGVSGILGKMNTGQNLPAALDFMKIRQDETYLDSWVDRILADSAGTAITRREHEVLELMAQGHTSDEIATKLKCAVTTVKTYRARIMNKSGARNASEMIAWYLKGNGKQDFGSDL